MYSNYSFVLEWDDLGENLQQDKILQYQAKCGEEITEQEAEQSIKARFPMYF